MRVWIGYAAPGTGGASAVLPANEVVEVEEAPLQTGWLFAHPRRYRELEQLLVPASYRESAYSGYALLIGLADIDRAFKVVPGEPGEHPITDILDHGRRVFAQPVDGLVRRLSRLVPRYRIFGMFDWRHPPGNDELEGMLRTQVEALERAARERDDGEPEASADTKRDGES